MVANFFRIALRNLFKNKIFSFINVFGLALGIASSLLIVEYARYELSYDKFEANSGRIYRLQLDRYNDGKLSTRWAAGAPGLGPAVKDALPEIESFARLSNMGGIMSYKDHQFRESKMYLANENFLPMFSYQTVAGSASGALKDVFTAVNTESTAPKYFGTEPAVGKMLSL